MLILTATLATLVYGLIAPILGALLPTYGLTAGQQAMLATLQAIGLIISSLSAGPLVDIKGNKSGLLIGLALIIASITAAPNAGGYSGLLVVYFVLGIGGGTIVTAANALISAIEPTRRSSVLNLINLFFGLGGIITTYVASEPISPAYVCYAIGALTLLTFLIGAATKMPGPAGQASFRVAEAPALLSRPALMLLCLMLFLYVSCEVGVWNWLKIYLETMHFSAISAGHVVSYGFAFGILLGRVVVSRILLKVRPLTVTLVASVCMAITTFLMLELSSRAAITAAVFCAGLSMAPMFPTTLGITGDTFRRGAATAMGIAITFGWIGLAVSSHIIGSLAGSSRDYHYALLLIPGFSLLLILVNLVLRPVLKHPIHEVAFVPDLE